MGGIAVVDEIYSPTGAANLLSERLGRSISRRTIAAYIAAGDLPASDIRGGQRPRYAIKKEDLDSFISQVIERLGPDGTLPAPSTGWPWPQGYQRKDRKKK
jgi:hypothetical protein